MPRPHCWRRVEGRPVASVFKPAGIPTHALDVVLLTLDEYEAVRLADLDGLYQEPAAARMGVSRPTFGRILESARGKLADALVHGKALKIEGGAVYAEANETVRCRRCAREWVGPPDGPAACPRCHV
jgi:predicted DNA-binding protein (UPF0251 family)